MILLRLLSNNRPEVQCSMKLLEESEMNLRFYPKHLLKEKGNIKDLYTEF